MLGYDDIPEDWVQKVEGLSEEKKREFIVKDNAHWGSEWDFDMLKDWNVDLQDFGVEVNFDDSSILNEDDVQEVEADDPNEVKTEIQEGDLFEIGKHRLMCGDSTKDDFAECFFEDKKVNLFLTDPPYSVNFSKKSKEIFNNKDYCDIKNDDMSVADTSEFIWKGAFKVAYDLAEDDCSFYVFMPQGGDQMMMMMMMMMNQNWQVKHELIWEKESPVFSMNRLDYDYKHEPIMYGWKKTHNFYGDYTDKSILKINRDGDKSHPTMKPIELLSKLIKNSSKESDLVYDAFGGSGSTMVACEQLNRVCYMMELDPIYCQVIINRMKKLNPDIEIKCLNREVIV